MSNYIIILSTAVNNPTDLQQIPQVIKGFTEIFEWSLDLDDCDKILRVVCRDNIGNELIKQLGMSGVYAVLLEVFNKEGKSLGPGSISVSEVAKYAGTP